MTHAADLLTLVDSASSNEMKATLLLEVYRVACAELNSVVLESAMQHAQATDKATALLHAVTSGDADLIQIALDNVDDASSYGNAALKKACERGDLTTVNLLLAIPEVVTAGMNSAWVGLSKSGNASIAAVVNAVAGPSADVAESVFEDVCDNTFHSILEYYVPVVSSSVAGTGLRLAAQCGCIDTTNAILLHPSLNNADIVAALITAMQNDFPALVTALEAHL